MIDRRELLVSFLGAPLAALACRRNPRPSIPPGELVGASDRVGHQLRGRLPSTASRWESQDVVIVGAGVAGLSAGWRLAHAEFTNYTMLELEPFEGGTARSGSSTVSAFPWGAHYIAAPSAENRALGRLLSEMEVIERYDSDGTPIVAEQFLCRDPEERIFFRGRWYEGLYLYAGATEDDLRQLHAFEAEIAKWVAWRDTKGRRAFTIPVAYGSDDSEVTALDSLSMRQWLDARRLTSSRLRWLVDYACRDDYGTRLDDTSAWAGVFYFASRVSKPGAESRSLVTWPEGNGRLVAHLSRASRPRLRTRALAMNVIPTTSGADVIVNSGDEVYGIHARRVIVAAPQFVTERIVRGLHEHSPHGREFTFGSWMVANITTRDRPKSIGFPMAWDNVLYESPSLGYVVATHQRSIDYGPTVLTYYYPLCDRDAHAARSRLLGTSREAWAEVALSDLSLAHRDIRTLAERIDVMRWGHAMVRPQPGFIWSESRRRAAAPFQSVHFAHSDLSGIALFEEAFFHGIRAAEEVLAVMNRPSRTFL